MSDNKVEKVITVEKRSGSDAKATVTQDGKTTEGAGKTARDALSEAGEKAKE